MSEENYMKPEPEALRAQLSEQAYNVTQEDGTEPPFDNLFWNEKRDGIYVDVVSGEALFSSLDKFDSGTGWPSFCRPMHGVRLQEKSDDQLATSRVEVRSQKADSHLGHLFNDGPLPTGLRYCINSAALRFIPKEEMENSGYAEFLSIFA